MNTSLVKSTSETNYDESTKEKGMSGKNLSKPISYSFYRLILAYYTALLKKRQAKEVLTFLFLLIFPYFALFFRFYPSFLGLFSLTRVFPDSKFSSKIML